MRITRIVTTDYTLPSVVAQPSNIGAAMTQASSSLLFSIDRCIEIIRTEQQPYRWALDHIHDIANIYPNRSALLLIRQALIDRGVLRKDAQDIVQAISEQMREQRKQERAAQEYADKTYKEHARQMLGTNAGKQRQSDEMLDHEEAAQAVGQQWAGQWAHAVPDRLYLWVGTHWQKCDELHPKAFDAAVNETLLKLGIPRKRPTTWAVRDFARRHITQLRDPRSELINFQNGTYNLTTDTLQPHDRADMLTYCLPYDYERSEYPTIYKALTEIVPDHVAIRAYMAHIGLSLRRDRKFHKALLLIGPKRSGKSTLLNLTMVSTGGRKDEFASGLIFSSEIEGLRAREAWHDQIMVGIDEMPDTALRDEGIFKIMIAHGGISRRAMGQLESKSNTWTPKIIMSTNDAPRYTDRSGALTARLIAIHCPNRRQDNELDLDLFDRMQPEIGAFIAACLDAAQDTLDIGQYPQSQGMRALLNRIERDGDALKSWFDDRCILDSSAQTTTGELYGNFKSYCETHGNKPLAMNRFTGALEDAYPGQIVRKKWYERGGQVRGLSGVRLRRFDDPDPDDMDKTARQHETAVSRALPSQGIEHQNATNDTHKTDKTLDPAVAVIQRDHALTVLDHTFSRMGENRDIAVLPVSSERNSAAQSTRAAQDSTAISALPAVSVIPVLPALKQEKAKLIKRLRDLFLAKNDPLYEVLERMNLSQLYELEHEKQAELGYV